MVQFPDEKYFDQITLEMVEMIDETNTTKNTIMHILQDRCLPCCNWSICIRAISFTAGSTIW